jgi:hypothetical protein
MGGVCNTHGVKRNAYGILVRTPKEKILLGRGRRRCENNIKMDIKEIEWCRMDWIDLAWDRDQWRALVNTLMNVRVP